VVVRRMLGPVELVGREGRVDVRRPRQRNVLAALVLGAVGRSAFSGKAERPSGLINEHQAAA